MRFRVGGPASVRRAATGLARGLAARIVAETAAEWGFGPDQLRARGKANGNEPTLPPALLAARAVALRRLADAGFDRRDAHHFANLPQESPWGLAMAVGGVLIPPGGRNAVYGATAGLGGPS